jgi:hypothetical protein
MVTPLSEVSEQAQGEDGGTGSSQSPQNARQRGRCRKCCHERTQRQRRTCASKGQPQVCPATGPALAGKADKAIEVTRAQNHTWLCVLGKQINIWHERLLSI